MLLDYLTELKETLTKEDFSNFMNDITNDIKVNRVAFNKRTSSKEFINICEILKGALAR